MQGGNGLAGVPGQELAFHQALNLQLNMQKRSMFQTSIFWQVNNHKMPTYSLFKHLSKQFKTGLSSAL
jgi:hypothetical protein